MNVTVTFTGRLEWLPDPEQGEDDRKSDIEGAFAGTMEELLKLEVTDPSVTGSLASGDIEISCQVEAATLLSAIDKGLACIRTALHAAGVRTQGWEEHAHAHYHVELELKAATFDEAQPLESAGVS